MNLFLKRTLKIHRISLNKNIFQYFSQNIKPETANSENIQNSKSIKSAFQSQNNQYSKQNNKRNRLNLSLEGINNEIDCKLIQAEINTIHTIDSLCNFYKQNKNKMDLVNICTCLDKAVDIAVKNFQYSGSPHPITEQPEVKEMIDYLTCNIHKMNAFAVSNSLSNLVKLGIHEENLINKLIKRILENSDYYSEKSLSYIIWGLARANIRNQKFLELIAKRILEKVIINEFLRCIDYLKE